MRKLLTLTLVALAACSPAPREGRRYVSQGVEFVELEAKRLPDLGKPRGGGVTTVSGGELLVLGGHTDGFRPLATAEYYKDGAWREVASHYTHDFGFATTLPDGSVMLGGGSSDNFGIGQSWGVEIFDPQTHAFRATGILDRKRSGVSAAVFPDGRIIAAGNWYAEDAIEVLEPGKGFAFLKEAAEPRACPYILPSGPKEVIIFGLLGIHGEKTSGIVDRIPGESYVEPMLGGLSGYWNLSARSGEETKIGEYDYLIPALRGEEKLPVILRVSSGRFSMLETQAPFPLFAPDSAAITWCGNLQVDRRSRTAWLPGFDSKGRFYAAEIGYDPIFEGEQAQMRICWAESPDGSFSITDALLLPDGRFVLVGGLQIGEDGKCTNFETSSRVYSITIQDEKPAGKWWIAVVLAVMAAIPCILALVSKKKSKDSDVTPDSDRGSSPAPKDDLMSRIVALMEQEELFRTKGLTKADVAKALGTNVSYVSASINNQAGKTFPEFVAEYRIDYACRLMKEHPEMVISEIGDEAGFASEQSFFRTFKAVKGLTPQEWKNAG